MPLQEAIILTYDASRDLNVYVSFPVEPKAAPDGTPALVFFHGGGLFMGNAETNEWAPKWLFEELSKKGVAIISAEYTLLYPQTGFDLIEDVKSVWTYIGTTLNKDLAEKASLRIDTNRLAVAGSSAGGYMAYLSAIYASSTPAKPRAAMPIYAMGGCYLLDHYLKGIPQGTYEWQPEQSGEQAALAWVASPPVSRCVRTPLDPDPKDPRLGFFGWTLNWGTFVDLLTGVKGLTEKLKPATLANRPALLPPETRVLFPDCCISKDLPPFYLLHAQGDTLILIDETRHIAAKLTEAGVKVELVEVPGGFHGFDNGPAEDDTTDGAWYNATLEKYLLPLADRFSTVFE